MSEQLPAFFPALKRNDLRLVPVTTKSSWIVMLQGRLDALDSETTQSLLNLGFTRGQKGRLFFPGPMTRQQMQSLCHTLGGELQVFNPEQMVELEGGARLEDSVPPEVRNAIGWWWANDREAMAREIQTTLQGNNDDMSRHLLQRYTQRQWRNPDRLKQWVEDALNGEINAITEPILGLALARVAQQRGGEDLEPEVDALRHRLIEFRGEQPKELVLDTPYRAGGNSAFQPPIGHRISWRNESGAVERGSVKRYAESNPDTIWVIPDRAHYVEGLTLPQTVNIRLDQILGPYGQRPSEGERPEAVSEGENEASRRSQARTHIELKDLPVSSLRNMASEEVPPARIRNIARIASRANQIMGINPLAPTVMGRVPDADETRMIVNWGPLREELGAPLNENTPAAEDARRYLRDTAIEEFNELQPESLPADADYPSLAVIPFSVSRRLSGFGESLDAVATTEAVEKQDRETLYAIGLHPRRGWEAMEQMGLRQTLDREQGIYNQAQTDAFTQRFIERFMSARALSLESLIPAKLVSERALWMTISEHDPQGDKTLEQSVQGLSGGLIHSDPAKAREELEAIYQGAAPDNVRQRGERNAAVLQAIGDISGLSQEELAASGHQMLDLAQRVGSEVSAKPVPVSVSLAYLGIDLERDAQLAGEIAHKAGISLTETTQATYALEAENGDPYHHRPVGAVFTGHLKVEGAGDRYFSLGVYGENEDLLETIGLSNGPARGAPLLSNTRGIDNTSMASIGRVAQIHARVGLGLTEPAHQPSLTPETAAGIPVRWAAVPGLSVLGQLPPDEALPPEAISYMGNHASDQPNVDDPKRASGLNEIVNTAHDKMLHSILGVIQEGDSHKKVSEAVRMWASSESFGRFGEGAVDRITGQVCEKLELGNEMVVVAHKTGSRRLYYDVVGVTLKDLQKAGFDRHQAIEQAVLSWRNMNRQGNSRYKISTFDPLSVLKPETLRALNAIKAEERSAGQGEGVGESDPEDAKANDRKNTGHVHGLSMKDMRGTRDDVLALIQDADATDRQKMIAKTRLWEAPDWVGMRSPEDGTTPMDPAVAAFWNELRKQAPSKSPADLPEPNRLFAKAMLVFRDEFGRARTLEDLEQAVAPEGDFAVKVQEIMDEIDDHGLNREQVLGKPFRFRNHRGYEALERLVNRAKQLSGANQHWPRGVGQKRAATRSGDTNAPKPGAMGVLDRLRRENAPEHRAGDRDITERELIETFGFSGIEYGESMPQRERSVYLNEAYDAFMDMAKALNVNPATLSMGGTLGLAFGSRGRGGRNAALAHFEPDNNVINLTRMKGAGSLAHEFGHTLANYFSRKVTGQRRGPGDLSEMVASQSPMGFLKTDQIGDLRKAVYDGFTTIMANAVFRPADNEDPSDGEEATALGRFDRVPLNRVGGGDRGRMSTFFNEAQLADRQQKRNPMKNPYWSDPKELFARSFETWVDYRLKAQNPGFRNDYLVRQDKLKAWSTPSSDQTDKPSNQRRVQLYPTGDHLKRLDHAFRQLFQTLETGQSEVQHEYLGKTTLPYLYSHDDSVIRTQPGDRAALAQCAIDEVVRMCGRSVALQWHRELSDDTGASVAGRFSVIEGDSSNGRYGVRGLIELAMGAPLSTAHHEAFHYAQHFLLTDKEKQMLERSFGRGKPLQERLEQALTDDGKGHLVENCQSSVEAQAYAYEQWVKGNLDVSDHQPVKSAFDIVQETLNEMRGVVRQYGFDTPENLFRNFYDGRLALRQELNLPGDSVDPSLTHAARLSTFSHDQECDQQTRADSGNDTQAGFQASEVIAHGPSISM